MFKPIPQLKQWHSFVFDKPGTVTCKLHSQSPESEFTMHCSEISDAMPSIITPIPLTPERQWYLYDSIRPLVPNRAQDILCPKPACPRITFSQVRAVREEQKNTELLRVQRPAIPLLHEWGNLGHASQLSLTCVNSPK